MSDMMMGGSPQITLEELAARLGELENSALQSSMAQEQTGFMDKYGTKFSGDEGIGVAILAELGRRGVDTSAADEAVQDILDQIRAEATAILDKIKMDERTVSDLMDKVSTVEESVAAATGAVPGADAMVGTPPPPLDLGGSGLGDAALMPGAETPADMGAAPPPDMGATAPPPDMGGGAPPPDMDAAGGAPPAAPMPAEMPPELQGGIPSDQRLKQIKGAFTQRKAATRSVYKPNPSILAAVRGKM
jgi:hypothetical protein